MRSIGTPRSLIPSSPDAKLFWLETGEFRNLPLTRNWNSHKGDFGHALLVAGSLGKTGAAGLAAMGALRSGAGLVTVATPDSVLPVVAGYAPEMMTEPLASTDAGSISMRSLEYGRFDSILKGKNVLAIGPGLSTDPETQQFVRSVVSSCPLPIILDADGLNAFVSHPDELAKRKSSFLAITPHPGEMARLLGCTSAEVQSRRLSVATEAAARWNVYVILKGAGTILATPDGRAFINTSGTPALATGGTGDVLTGLLAGLTAQFGTSQWEKVLGLGIYLHGKAAEQLVAGHAHPHLLASDVAHAIPAAFDSLCREMSSDE
ncbi:MAG: NAD(P)H-hydrate dehydratase [Acidobacteria bacterium]|nr:NAD(P)H-hydrate dehydratase [Acidobacteriota bacterium]